jgi:hypothetical protein
MLTPTSNIENKRHRSLFIICPFSQLEAYIISEFGNQSCFLTAAGSVLFLDQDQYPEAIKDFLIREEIEEIVAVNDYGSVFIRNAMNEAYEPVIETASVLHRIYQENHTEINSLESHEKKCRYLSLLNCNRQITELLQCEVIGKVIQRNKIQLKCLVLNSKSKDAKLIEYNKIAAGNEF